MQHPFKHPLATHAAGTVLGYRRNGSPIYAIAGGSGESEGAPVTPPAGEGTPPAASPAATPPAPAQGEDWEAKYREATEHSRKWEKRAKENSGALTELETLRAANLTEQEKAVAAAEKNGRTAAAAEYGKKLAAAEFRAAVAGAGIDLGEASDLIDTTKFVVDGEVDTDAIKAAVKKLAKLAPRGAGRSGADLSGGAGEQPHNLDKQIAEATAKRDFNRVIALKRQRAAQT